MGLLLSLLLAQAVTPVQLRAGQDIARPVGATKLADGGYVLNVYISGQVAGGGSAVVASQGASQDGGGPWAELLPGVVDTGNSSTAALGIGATFTGAWADVLNYPVINVTAFSDVVSATGGWLLQWSDDATNVAASEALTLAAGSGRALALNARARYFRQVYTNGGVGQTAFRIGSILRQSGNGVNNYPVNKAITDSSLSTLTRSVIAGVTTGGGGGYVNVKVNPSGALVADVTQSTSPWVVSGAVTTTPPSNASTNVTQFGSNNVATGVGASGVGIPRVTVANDSNVLSTQSGTWTVQPGNTPNTAPWLTTDTPRVVASASNTGTCTTVGVASVTVLASNANRKAYGIKASEANTVNVFCKLGATATTSNMPFGKGSAWSQDTGAVYTGVIDCISGSASQTVCVYEFQ
jgi:hypothetical protein